MAGNGYGQGELPLATVHVEVFGPFGSQIKASRIQLHLYTRDGKRDLVTASRGSITGVPYGVYRLSASDGSLGLGERELVVNTKEVWARVGVAFAIGDRIGPAGNLAISGEITPKPKPSGDWWVRVEGVFLQVRKEGPILGSGKFSVEGLDMGTYLVEIYDNSRLRRVEEIEIDSNKPNTYLVLSIPPGEGIH